VDTAVAHLAGALGVDCWVAVSAVSDWRWLAGWENSPWYPTVCLYRQVRLSEWFQVLMAMAEKSEHGPPVYK
jgi:hypothetical protein